MIRNFEIDIFINGSVLGMLQSINSTPYGRVDTAIDVVERAFVAKDSGMAGYEPHIKVPYLASI